ncbi:nitroreductase family protein [Chloroflexia bacterium SDU3-3]|nr:nitroreductase family protein [Chloroflexia bacterium SDU3-3]
MLDKSATTDHEIHPLLRSRWSPRAFSPEPIPAEMVKSLLEAARWAPSAMNEQPWEFIVVPREDAEAFAGAVSTLAEGNVSWAKNAPLLIFAVARLTSSYNGAENGAAIYDLGQAVAHLSVQASALGLWTHQMGGFSADKAREVFGIPEGYKPMVVIAVGSMGDADTLVDVLRERELGPRVRKPISAFVYEGKWGEPAKIIG